MDILERFKHFLETHHLLDGYFPPPKKNLLGFPNAKPVPAKTPMRGGKLRKRWRNDDADILDWDYQHGKIERYDSRGKHKGEFDPDTGKQTKPADSNRNIKSYL